MAIITAFNYISMSIPIPNKVSRHQEPSQNIKGISQNFISVSSDELQDQSQPPCIRDQEVCFQLVTRPINQKEQARKNQQRSKNAIELLRLIQEQNKDSSRLRQQVAVKMQKYKEKAKMEQQLKKEFSPFTFLPIQNLSYLKGQLANFEKYCFFEQVEEKQKVYLRMRQDFRKSLTKGMLVSLEEIKFKIPESQHTEFQRKILSPQADSLKYCYKHASQLQRYFFTKICKKDTRFDVRKYQQQIKIVLREYSDKNNIDLRRKIINQKVTFRQLATATEQSLKCQKTIQQEQEKLKQIVRQSYLNPFQMDNIEPQQKSQQPQMGSFNNIGSISSFGNESIYAQPKQTVQEKNMREKKEMLKNLREKYRKCQQSFIKHSRNISKIQEILKETHLNNSYFSELCKNMQIIL